MILWRDQREEHGGTRRPPHPPLQAPHVYHVPTFNNTRVSHGRAGTPNTRIWSDSMCLAAVRCVRADIAEAVGRNDPLRAALARPCGHTGSSTFES